MRILIAGASGFVGRWLINSFGSQHDIIATSRNKFTPDLEKPNLVWKQVDYFSRQQTLKALKGVDIAIYLVHSMLPKSKLFQGQFYDLDLLMADNFASSAKENGIKKIIYLSGIIPNDQKLSYHLQSRLEVEETLSQFDTPFTSLRTGIIVGPGGSSYNILVNLVNHLPVMICPKWTLNQSQPVSLEFILSWIKKLIEDPTEKRQIINLYGKESLTYKKMILETAKTFNKKPFIIDLPIFSTRLSKLWVSIFGRAQFSLVSPLVDSLKHDLTIKNDERKQTDQEDQTFIEMAKLAKTTKNLPPLVIESNHTNNSNDVRSIQRLVCPPGKSSKWVSQNYALWLQKNLGFIINVVYKENKIHFYFLNFKKYPLLVLTHAEEKSTENRRVYFITKGLLVKKEKKGWLEFRKIFQGRYILTAIHDYYPSLPWFLYRYTQALVHLFIMNRFGSYLEKYEETKD